jgi:aspartyl-tRNA(Asn)/glutamyl-tRNA(Gln) amidotransferase subunit C
VIVGGFAARGARGYSPLMGGTDDGIDPAYVRKVARLARLTVDDAAATKYASQMAAVVSYIDRLRELDLTDVEPMAHAGEESDPTRSDEPGPTLATDVLMAMAPDVMPPFVRIPKTLDEGGGA